MFGEKPATFIQNATQLLGTVRINRSGVYAAILATEHDTSISRIVE
jgi:hypothetical protein